MSFLGIIRKVSVALALLAGPTVLVAAAESSSNADGGECCSIAWCDGSTTNHCGTIYHPGEDPVNCDGSLSEECARMH